MQGVLALEKILENPAGILGKKFSRIRLPNGQVAEFMRTASQEGARRRDYVVRFRSTSRKRVRGAEEVGPVYVYGAVHHYIVVYVARKPMAFAYIECVMSTVDLRGAFGLAQKRRDTECFSSLGEVIRDVNVLAIDNVVGTLYVDSRYTVLYCRETFRYEE